MEEIEKSKNEKDEVEVLLEFMCMRGEILVYVVLLSLEST